MHIKDCLLEDISKYFSDDVIALANEIEDKVVVKSDQIVSNLFASGICTYNKNYRVSFSLFNNKFHGECNCKVPFCVHQCIVFKTLQDKIKHTQTFEPKTNSLHKFITEGTYYLEKPEQIASQTFKIDYILNYVLSLSDLNDVLSFYFPLQGAIGKTSLLDKRTLVLKRYYCYIAKSFKQSYKEMLDYLLTTKLANKELRILEFINDSIYYSEIDNYDECVSLIKEVMAYFTKHKLFDSNGFYPQIYDMLNFDAKHPYKLFDLPYHLNIYAYLNILYLDKYKKLDVFNLYNPNYSITSHLEFETKIILNNLNYVSDDVLKELISYCYPKLSVDLLFPYINDFNKKRIGMVLYLKRTTELLEKLSNKDEYFNMFYDGLNNYNILISRYKEYSQKYNEELIFLFYYLIYGEGYNGVSRNNYETIARLFDYLIKLKGGEYYAFELIEILNYHSYSVYFHTVEKMVREKIGGML